MEKLFAFSVPDSSLWSYRSVLTGTFLAPVSPGQTFSLAHYTSSAGEVLDGGPDW